MLERVGDGRRIRRVPVDIEGDLECILWAIRDLALLCLRLPLADDALKASLFIRCFGRYGKRVLRKGPLTISKEYFWTDQASCQALIRSHSSDYQIQDHQLNQDANNVSFQGAIAGNTDPSSPACVTFAALVSSTSLLFNIWHIWHYDRFRCAAPRLAPRSSSHVDESLGA